jgi:hypothetical protein
MIRVTGLVGYSEAKPQKALREKGPGLPLVLIFLQEEKKSGNQRFSEWGF